MLSRKTSPLLSSLTISFTAATPTRQALALWPLAPIGPHDGADDAAAGADHARTEGRHSNALVVGVDVEHGFVVAQSSQRMDNDRTPFARMFASVIGGPR